MRIGDNPELGPTELRMTYRQVETPPTPATIITTEMFLAEMEVRLTKLIVAQSEENKAYIGFVSTTLQSAMSESLSESYRQFGITVAKLSVMEQRLQNIEDRGLLRWVARIFRRIFGERK